MTLPKVKHSLASKTAKPQKLKCILAQPFPKYRPVISSEDAGVLRNIISASHWKSDCKVGLRSSLRKTNTSSDFSCLLLSTKIKPFFVSWQIIHSITVREKIPKVFCFPNLEELTESCFGKKSIALLLPTSSQKDIQNWLGRQQELHPVPRNLLPKENVCEVDSIKEKEFEPSLNIQDFYVSPSENRSFEPTIVRRKNPLSLEKVDKSWSGDFISFGDVDMKEVGSVDSEEERDNLQNILSKFSKKSPTKELKKAKKKEQVRTTNLQESKKASQDVHTDDEFLEDYLGVTVQKIQKNPDKIKKNNKKKKKKTLKS